MPYNSETETFYQAPATVVDSTPDGDTVQEGFDDRLTPALAGLYADLNLLKADGMISVGIPATTTARGIGRVATSADLVDGATISNGPAFLAAGSAAVTTTPTPNAVPQANANGKLDGWVSLASKANTDLSNVDMTKANVVLQQVRYKTSALATGTATIPQDGTVPQQSEGTQFMSLDITPKRATSILQIDVMITGNGDTADATVALFKDNISDAIAATSFGEAEYSSSVSLSTYVAAGDTNLHTFKVRCGTTSGYFFRFNGRNGSVIALYGAASASSIIITEFAA